VADFSQVAVLINVATAEEEEGQKCAKSHPISVGGENIGNETGCSGLSL